MNWPMRISYFTLFLTIAAFLFTVGVTQDWHDARLRAGLARWLRRVAGRATRWEWNHVPPQ